MCLRYPDTRYFIARETLKNLKKTTLRTFFKVARHHGLYIGHHYEYNEQSSTITFPHKDEQGRPCNSTIDLLEVKYKPSDPDYEDLGSSEYTSGWIEEAGEVNFGAYDTLKSRVGRHNNAIHKILGKLYITCNPKKNWLYQSFYKPYRDGTLSPHMRFIPSFVDDNPNIEPGYREKLLSIKDNQKRQRLLYGMWEYDDSQGSLMSYDAITALFVNKLDRSDETYISVDAARKGGDKIVIYLWKGWRVIKAFVYRRLATTSTEQRILKVAGDEEVPYSHIVVDEDGVGGGIVDHLPGVKGFINNARPIFDKYEVDPPNYGNLKTQCYYMMADRINTRDMAVQLVDFVSDEDEINEEAFKEDLIEELEQVKAKDPDSDEKRLYLTPKEKVKEQIGRSPDYSDALMMRFIFELNKEDGGSVHSYRPGRRH